jgi:hypothetical protein
MPKQSKKRKIEEQLFARSALPARGGKPWLQT